MCKADDEVILDHYRSQATIHGLDPSSTMADTTVREREVGTIVASLREISTADHPLASVLEVGCGNGYLLSRIRTEFRDLTLAGCDYSSEMLELARNRGLPNCVLQEEDVRALSFAAESFDVVISERCIINVLDESGQREAIAELHRVLRPGGFALLIEAFTDGRENLNRAREQLGLEAIPVPHHNRWMEKSWFQDIVSGLFLQANDEENSIRFAPSNFLSSHYFISRVLYPSVTRRPVIHNTDFVQFFGYLPPYGDYSPIQFFVLKKIVV